jgi:stearoyl-CoA desaturase (delta-9 desaturase)
MGTKEWASIHRKHHAKCETADDPHSPQILGINRVLWGGVFLYVKEAKNKETLQRYGHGTPNDWIENHLYTPLQKLGIVVMLLTDIVLFGALPGCADLDDASCLDSLLGCRSDQWHRALLGLSQFQLC